MPTKQESAVPLQSARAADCRAPAMVGAGLRLYNGSRLLLNGINCYGLLNGQIRRLNDLIPAGTNFVAFDGGFIANSGGPRITSMAPAVTLQPPVSSADVSFDLPIDQLSFTPADVTITGPSGPVAATGVTLLSNTTYRVSFAPQTADGVYKVQIGPNIDEVAGNLHGLDQNGDGLCGDGTNDVFTSGFVIDGTPPSLVGAYALQGGICAYLMVAIVRKQLNGQKSLNEILQIVSVNIFEQTSLAEMLASTLPLKEQIVGDHHTQNLLWPHE